MGTTARYAIDCRSSLHNICQSRDRLRANTRYAEWRRTWGSVVFFEEPHQEDAPMVRSSDSLESQLLTLPPADRARLAELLLASLDTDLDAGSATVIEDAWREEATIRLQELRAGTVSGIPAWQVFEAATRRLAP